MSTMSPCARWEGREGPSSQPERRACRVLVGQQRAPAVWLLLLCPCTHLQAWPHAQMYDHNSDMPPPTPLIHAWLQHTSALTSTSPRSVWFAHPQLWPACGPRGEEEVLRSMEHLLVSRPRELSVDQGNYEGKYVHQGRQVTAPSPSAQVALLLPPFPPLSSHLPRSAPESLMRDRSALASINPSASSDACC